jgi:hypothetical protein
MNSFFFKIHPLLILPLSRDRLPRGGTCHQFLPIWLKTFLAFPGVRSGVIILSLTSLLYGCILQDGKWDDNIKLSVKKVEFSADGDSAIIKTKGTWWWVTDISVNKEYFYGFGINPDSENYSIKDYCFVVERRDAHTLFIKVDANPRDSVRVITVGLEAGDYFDRVTVTQKAK